MERLKKCPFCGSEAELYSYEAEREIYDSDTLGYVDTEYFTKYGVSCTGCNCLIGKRLYDNYYVIRHDMEVKKQRRERFRPVSGRKKKWKKKDRMFK